MCVYTEIKFQIHKCATKLEMPDSTMKFYSSASQGPFSYIKYSTYELSRLLHIKMYFCVILKMFFKGLFILLEFTWTKPQCACHYNKQLYKYEVSKT